SQDRLDFGLEPAFALLVWAIDSGIQHDLYAFPCERGASGHTMRLPSRQSSYSMCRIIGCACPCSMDWRALRTAAIRVMSMKYACATPQSRKQQTAGVLMTSSGSSPSGIGT